MAATKRNAGVTLATPNVSQRWGTGTSKTKICIASLSFESLVAMRIWILLLQINYFPAKWPCLVFEILRILVMFVIVSNGLIKLVFSKEKLVILPITWGISTKTENKRSHQIFCNTLWHFHYPSVQETKIFYHFFRPYRSSTYTRRPCRRWSTRSPPPPRTTSWCGRRPAPRIASNVRGSCGGSPARVSAVRSAELSVTRSAKICSTPIAYNVSTAIYRCIYILSYKEVKPTSLSSGLCESQSF